jgi:hypothetical protein
MNSELIEKFRRACLSSKNEEDIRLATNIFLDGLTTVFDLKKTVSSEVTSLQGGRADTIYSDLIFEFKTPNKFNSSQGVDEAVNGRDEKDRGLFHYLVNFSLEATGKSDNEYFKYILASKVGIGFDGKKFVFCRFKSSDNEIEIKDAYKTKNFPSNINSKQSLDFDVEVIDNFDLGIKKLLLFARSTRRNTLSAENLLLSFSSSSVLTKKSIRYLYQTLEQGLAENTRIRTLFDEWNRIFGDIYGKQETDFTKFNDDLREMYSLPDDVEIRKCLFVLQTYYSIVIKLLIHNLLESLTDPVSSSKKPAYKNELSALFSGNHHTNYFIDNFFEIHFFEWFILAESFEIDFIHDIINELDTYETTASVIKPEIVSDVLKKVYSNLIPRGLRHLMGEYYTPDWLVDFTIEKSQFNFASNSTVLDPTCGSGTFLTHLIKRFRERHKDTIDGNTLIKLVTKNIVGFDINPIAVISAKANYILALGDITQLDSEISIPVYMCDSILVPTVHAKQVEKTHSIKINTIVGDFEVPVFDSRENNDYFLKTVSSCILKDYTSYDEFDALLQQEGVVKVSGEQQGIARAFYDKLHNLHLSGRNGFWPIILKNSFAPLFSHDKFDVVIGNPPWITWKAMSDTYRKLTLDIWLSYGIFEKSAYDKITSHDDFAMAVTYVSIDHYLKKDGIAAYVLPQTFVKSLKGGEGFRKFEITRDGQNTPFAVNEVYDMLRIKPFQGEASNRTSVYIFQKNKKMIYPMDSYFECDNLERKQQIKYSDSYETVKKKLKLTRLSAKPINNDERSPWLTVNPATVQDIGRYLGKSPYMARKGIEPCGAKGVYLVKINKKVGKNIQIENLIERSRLEKAKILGVHIGEIEKDFVYPMVGGRNFDKWGLNSHLYMVVPHANTGKGIYRGVDEKELKTKYKKTYEWLFYFKDLLLETRIRSGKFFDEKQFPFYRLDNVGDYTFSKYKILWKEQSRQMTAVVVSSLDDEFVGKKTIVTDSKVLYVSFENEKEANYLCAILNSRLIGEIIEAYTIDVQKGVDIVKNINIPKYDHQNKLHEKLADLSIKAHELYKEGKENQIEGIEDQIEKTVPLIFQ